MKRITIERYDARPSSPFYDAEFAKTRTMGYAGCIEGETDDGVRWIMWLDAQGRPEVFWPRRDAEGGVIGRGVPLTIELRDADTSKRMAKLRQILDSGTPEEAVERLRAALDAAEKIRDGSSESMDVVEQLLAKDTPEQKAGKPQL